MRLDIKQSPRFSTPTRNLRVTPRRQRSSRLFISQEFEIGENKSGRSQVEAILTKDFFGLPSRVQELLKEHRGISTLYEWQSECLNLTSVCNGSNLVYSLPTSGGKTLVAEILMLKELLIHSKSVLFILPFVSIVQEKVRSLTPLGLELGFWVEEYAGNRGRIPPVKRRGSYSVLMATIEKAHTIVNSLIDSKSLDDIGLVIVDELHMIGDGGSRGACLEITLAKIRIASSNVRIIGMSATLSNITDLTKFLNAELYTNDFRPVKLIEYVKVGDHTYEIKSENVSEKDDLADCLVHKRMTNFQYNKKMLTRDPDHLVALVAETLLGYSIDDTNQNYEKMFDSSFQFSCKQRFSCLVFCPTKTHCENTARMLAELLPKTACFPSPDDVNYHAEKDLVEKRMLLLENLRLDNVLESANSKLDNYKSDLPTVCPVLEFTVPRGVAYHHSGLTQEERTALETAYNEGTIRVLCCTSTLAAGVNLPARRVIIRKPYVGNLFITSTQYRQMIGRAGRAGLDSIGESITILQPNERSPFSQIICAKTCGSNIRLSDNEASTKGGLCYSSLLYENGKGLRHFLLSLIGLELAVTYSDLIRCCEKTLLAVQSYLYSENLDNHVRTELKALIKMNLISVNVSEKFQSHSSPSLNACFSFEKSKFQATKLGRASVKGGIDTDRIGPLLDDLRLAARAINTSGPLHLLYLVAPPDVVDQTQVDWNMLYDRVNLLSESESNFVSLLGFPEGYILWKVTGHPIKRKLDERPLHRLYVALALADLWEHKSTMPIWHIAERYKLSRGALQSLLNSAASVAHSLAFALASEYSTDSELWAFAHLLPEFANKLAYCVSSELLPLMELPGVKRARARQLYNAGYCTLKDIACTNASDLTRKLFPFLSKRVAVEIIQAAQMILSERASALYHEANEMITGLKTKSLLSQLAEGLKVKPFSPKFSQGFKLNSGGETDSFSSPTDNDEDLFA